MSQTKKKLPVAEQRAIADAVVARGIAWLDANKPGWREEVDVATLDLAYPCTCVLGQLEGEFYEAAWRLNLAKKDTCQLGLSAPRDVTYPQLTAAWKRALRAKVGA